MTTPSLPRPVGRQREVLYLPARGHIVVLGTAGSGKTTLAILRSLYLSDPSTDHGGRTLLVTFNRCLVTYMQHLAGQLDRPVDVRNYHHFARGYLGSKNKLGWGTICRRNERLGFVEEAVQAARATGVQHPLLGRPREFFDEEFQWIQRHGIGHQQDYVDAKRISRSTRIKRSDRAVVFDLYRRYVNHRWQAGKLYDWDDLASAVRRELGDDDGVRLYRHVVIDEGQDFSPDFLPTDEQAEVLIPDRIGCGDINGVVVQDEKQAALEKSRLDLAGLTVPRFVVVPEFFDPYALSGSLRSGRLPVEREYPRGGAHA